MENAFSTFYIRKMHNNGSFLETLGDACLAPIRTLFGGREVIHIDGCFIVPPKFGEHLFKKIMKIALSVIFLVPAAIIGSLIKAAALLEGSVRRSHNNFRALFTASNEGSAFFEDAASGRFLFLGDRSSFMPSGASSSSGYPWEYLRNHIKNPTCIDLSSFKMAFIDWFFSVNAEWRDVKSLDLSNSNITDNSLLCILKKCPNLETLNIEGCERLTAKSAILITSLCDKMEHTTQTIDSLDLSDLEALTNADLTKIISKYPEITLLNLSGCTEITTVPERENAVA